MVVRHGSVGIARTVNEQCARRVRLRSSAAYHPASTATTGQESTVTLVMMVYTAAQCSKKYYHRRKVWRQHLLSAYQTPCEATSAAATDLHALGCHETVFCCGCKNIKHLVLCYSTSTYVRHPQRDSSTRPGAGISTPDFRKPFRDRDSGIFFAEIWSDPGCIKVGFLRFGQIRGQKISDLSA